MFSPDDQQQIQKLIAATTPQDDQDLEDMVAAMQRKDPEAAKGIIEKIAEKNSETIGAVINNLSASFVDGLEKSGVPIQSIYANQTRMVPSAPAQEQLEAFAAEIQSLASQDPENYTAMGIFQLAIKVFALPPPKTKEELLAEADRSAAKSTPSSETLTRPPKKRVQNRLRRKARA